MARLELPRLLGSWRCRFQHCAAPAEMDRQESFFLEWLAHPLFLLYLLTRLYPNLSVVEISDRFHHLEFHEMARLKRVLKELVGLGSALPFE